MPVDTEGQLMAHHAEMMGLIKYCAHLAECLLLMVRRGRMIHPHPSVDPPESSVGALESRKGLRTAGFEYGKAAAGPALATALATDFKVGVEGASPAAMDPPSMPFVEAHRPNYHLDRLIVYD